MPIIFIRRDDNDPHYLSRAIVGLIGGLIFLWGGSNISNDHSDIGGLMILFAVFCFLSSIYLFWLLFTTNPKRLE